MARAATYEIRIRGRLSDATLASFEDMRATRRPAETVLRGRILDQAALHGLLDRAGTMGLELISVRRVGEDEDSLDDSTG